MLSGGREFTGGNVIYPPPVITPSMKKIDWKLEENVISLSEKLEKNITLKNPGVF